MLSNALTEHPSSKGSFDVGEVGFRQRTEWSADQEIPGGQHLNAIIGVTRDRQQGSAIQTASTWHRIVENSSKFNLC